MLFTYNGKRLFYAFDEKVEVEPRIHKLEIEELLENDDVRKGNVVHD
jgi:hypothetical protein